jgi:VWFA-related protein
MTFQTIRRLGITALLVVASGAVPGVAQQQPRATFRSGVTLVTVDVTVLDSDGHAVTGLSADDFQIRLDGKLQPVRTLSYITWPGPAEGGAAARVAATTVAGRPVITNTPRGDGPGVLVLAIDDMSFAAVDGRRMLAAARTFVQNRPAGILVGLTTTSGAIAVNPTHDRSAITDALGRISGSFIDPRKTVGSEAPTIGIAEAIEIGAHSNTQVLTAAINRECAGGDDSFAAGNAIGNYNTKCASDVMSSARLIASLSQGAARQQVSALARTAAALKEVPGVKQMIVLTQGMAGTRNLENLFEPMVTAAAAAGVQLSILTEDEDNIDLSTQERLRTALGQSVGGTGIAARRREDRLAFMLGLKTLADMAGGTFERVISNTEGAFRRAALAGTAIYRLGVEAPPDAGAERSLTVEAAVTRRDVTVRVNRRAVGPSTTAEATPASRVTAAMTTGARFHAVPIRMSVARRRAAGDRLEVSLDLNVQPPAPGPVRITVGMLDNSGKLTQGAQTLASPDRHGGYRHTVAMPVTAGSYHVRVAAEDADGNVGSVSAPVDARLNRMGPMNVSDLLTWRKDSSGRPQILALDQMPDGLDSLSAGIELYPIAGERLPSKLIVRLSIIADGAATPVASIDVTPRVDGDVHRAQAALPLSSLTPGSYLIRAAVLADGQPLGEVSTLIKTTPR